MPMLTCHEGENFRVERSGLREIIYLLHKPTGRLATLQGDRIVKFYDAVFQCLKYYPDVANDGEKLYAWIWTNAGFHRFA